MRTLVLISFVIGIAASPAAALTYTFSGNVQVSELPPLAPGTPFSGTFTIDSSAERQQVDPFFYEFPQASPPANLTINFAGLTVQSSGNGRVQVQDSLGRIKFVQSFNTVELLGAGWSVEPSPGSIGVRASFITIYTGTPPVDLTQPLPFDLVNEQANFQVVLGPGVYTYPGGQLTVPNTQFGSTMRLEITELTLVPEPSTCLLAAAGAAALVTLRLRRCRIVSG